MENQDTQLPSSKTSRNQNIRNSHLSANSRQKGVQYLEEGMLCCKKGVQCYSKIGVYFRS